LPVFASTACKAVAIHSSRQIRWYRSANRCFGWCMALRAKLRCVLVRSSIRVQDSLPQRVSADDWGSSPSSGSSPLRTTTAPPSHDDRISRRWPNRSARSAVVVPAFTRLPFVPGCRSPLCAHRVPAAPSVLLTWSSSWSPARRTGLWGCGGHPRIYWRLITSFPAVRSLQPSASRRSLHGHMAYLFGGEPVAQGQQIVGHRPERPNRLARLTLRARHDHTRHYSLLVHVQSTTALIQNVHTTPSL